MSEVRNPPFDIDSPISDLFTQVMELPDDGLTEDIVESLGGMIEGSITDNIRAKSIKDIIDTFEAQNYTRDFVQSIVEKNRKDLEAYVEDLQPSAGKKLLLDKLVEIFCGIFEEALDKYHSYDFELPIKLDEGAKEPSYAHDTDAAADVYALEDTTLPPHSLSNVVHTGLRIALPERWVAYILPRSSIGMKTGLRLSNSVGVIDSGYRGEIGVMYDNHSDSEYVIHKGDRIAQMIIAPVHQFKPVQVDILGPSDRGEGGFGSTGK